MRVRLLLLMVLAHAHCVFAQIWPVKPVRFILPNSAGSGPDVVARRAAQMGRDRARGGRQARVIAPGIRSL